MHQTAKNATDEELVTNAHTYLSEGVRELGLRFLGKDGNYVVFDRVHRSPIERPQLRELALGAMQLIQTSDDEAVKALRERTIGVRIL